VAQNKTYEIKWDGRDISYIDIYLRYVCCVQREPLSLILRNRLSQQTSRNDTINPVRGTHGSKAFDKI
jgi:hypothetical protein